MSEICNIKLSTMVNRNTCHRYIHKEKDIYIYHKSNMLEQQNNKNKTDLKMAAVSPV